MGIKGLQGFVQNSCPDAFTIVNLKEMARVYMTSNPGLTPTIVVDAMCCLRYWYTPEAWVHGGQWREYISSLSTFVEAFRSAGIRLVFIFDGVVEQKKRDEWVRRRLNNNKEISKIFHHIKTHGQQPGRHMFFIPSGLSTFTRFALKTLGQEVMCSQREGDYEVAAYGLQYKCLGILGEDTDYFIFNTVPYFSINKLRLDRLTTFMFSRDKLCCTLGLQITDLPLFACLLGNDVMSEEKLGSFHRKCMATCQANTYGHNKRANTISAVASFISHVPEAQRSWKALDQILPVDLDRTLLYNAQEEYILPGQTSPWLYPCATRSKGLTDGHEMAMCLDQDILQIANEQHRRGDNSMICNVLCNGEVECSNTLEDEADHELLGQAIIYRSVRQHIYAVLLGTGKGTPGSCPSIKEWFVYPGNPLQHPEIVKAVQPDMPGGMPGVRALWLTDGPEVETLRLQTCLACFHAEDSMEELRALEAPIASVCCLLIYLFQQVDSLSLEDLEAFIAQTLCLQSKSADQLKDLQISHIDSRAVHLSFLFVRGIITMMGANSACGFPFTMDDLMPWKVFDGKLFHQKYLQSHRGSPMEALLECNETLLAQFRNLKSLICNACAAKKRTIQSNRRDSGQGTFQRRPDAHYMDNQATHFTPSNRNHNHPYHGQTRGHQWRSPHPGSDSSESQFHRSGRGYHSVNRVRRGRGFQSSPRWPQ
ncbi:constitutive coactivator of peroxisome proliferator-activated receptor gamma isoform X2 [Ambystoma mexicanum]|uniref:constitutive coactivator of peroxisome proliferator-activated receptor gamma isoform X2 n=1 Tax=Ambystoma mexicanum TaxID=8296 RepID=UPI0037E76865